MDLKNTEKIKASILLQPEYVSLEDVLGQITADKISTGAITIDFNGAFERVKKKRTFGKIFISSKTKEKEIKYIQAAFDMQFNSPMNRGKIRQYTQTSNASKGIYPTITLIAIDGTNNQERFQNIINLAKLIVESLTNLSIVPPITNSMFLFDKSIVGKRTEPASKLYKDKIKELNAIISKTVQAKNTEEAKEKVASEKRYNSEIFTPSLRDKTTIILKNKENTSYAFSLYDSKDMLKPVELSCADEFLSIIYAINYNKNSVLTLTDDHKKPVIIKHEKEEVKIHPSTSLDGFITLTSSNTSWIFKITDRHKSIFTLINSKTKAPFILKYHRANNQIDILSPASPPIPRR